MILYSVKVVSKKISGLMPVNFFFSFYKSCETVNTSKTPISIFKDDFPYILTNTKLSKAKNI